MGSQTRKALVTKRAAVKARMSHIKKFIDSLQDTVDVHDVNVSLTVIIKGAGRTQRCTGSVGI